MGNPKAFITIGRKEGGYRPVSERIGDFGEVEQTLDENDRREQASRCMECGVPFCHWACPVSSKMPEWQDALYRGNWEEAYAILTTTNILPEITGRICPALCEKSCVLSIHNEPLTIRENECSVVEHAFELGIVIPRIPKKRTNFKVAVIGAGPSGISAADILNQAGHQVTVFEKDESVGGLLRFGIPDFKLNKGLIDRRIQILEAEGITFTTGVEVGKDVAGEKLMNDFDAVLITIGAAQPRDLKAEGRDLKGVYFALDFLKQQNRAIAGKVISEEERILAKDKHVLVIGGGDTGSDCVGTSIRQKALMVTQIEIMPEPSTERRSNNPWPYWPNVKRTSSSHLEGCERRWDLSTKRFIGENGALTGVEVARVEWKKDASGKIAMHEVPGTVEIIPAELVMLSMGFVHPVHEGLLNELGLELDGRGNVKVGSDYSTSKAKVFAAGDTTRGASLVVHAISSGREAAEKVNEFLKSKKSL